MSQQMSLWAVNYDQHLLGRRGGGGGGGGGLPYISYIGLCNFEWYGFQAV